MELRPYYIIALLTFQLIFAACEKQLPPSLEEISKKAKVMTIYDINPLTNYSEPQLRSTFKVEFDINLFRDLALKAKYNNKEPFYKGGRLAIIELTDGSKIHLALSYGGSLIVLGTAGFFYFEGGALKKWEEEYFQKIIHENFIPKRIERNKN